MWILAHLREVLDQCWVDGWLQALALGADAVMIGRPLLWGLAVNGQQGVHDVLATLRSEVNLTMVRPCCNAFMHNCVRVRPVCLHCVWPSQIFAVRSFVWLKAPSGLGLALLLYWQLQDKIRITICLLHCPVNLLKETVKVVRA